MNAGRRSSRRRLNAGLDLGGRPFLLPPGVLPDEGPVLVELDVLVAVVHQAVPAVPGLDLPAQRALAALQWLLVVVTAREGAVCLEWPYCTQCFALVYWGGGTHASTASTTDVGISG